MRKINSQQALESAKNGKTIYGEYLYDEDGNECGYNFCTSDDLYDKIKDIEKDFQYYIEIKVIGSSINSSFERFRIDQLQQICDGTY